MDSNISPRPRNKIEALTPWVLGVVLGVSALANIGLGLAVNSLKGAMQAVKDVGQLNEGEMAPLIVAASLDGSATTVPYDEVKVPTIVYLFSASCNWCERNAANMNALAAGEKGRYRLLALSLAEDGVREYTLRHKFTFPVFVKPAASTVSGFKMAGTPMTYVIGNDGKVQAVWAGAYIDSLKTEVEQYLQVSLPGVTEAPSVDGDLRKAEKTQ